MSKKRGTIPTIIKQTSPEDFEIGLDQNKLLSNHKLSLLHNDERIQILQESCKRVQNLQESGKNLKRYQSRQKINQGTNVFENIFEANFRLLNKFQNRIQ